MIDTSTPKTTVCCSDVKQKCLPYTIICGLKTLSDRNINEMDFSRSLSHPHCVMYWSAICDHGISWSYSLTVCTKT